MITMKHEFSGLTSVNSMCHVNMHEAEIKHALQRHNGKVHAMYHSVGTSADQSNCHFSGNWLKIIDAIRSNQ